MKSSSIACLIAVKRLSATAENWEKNRPNAIAEIFEDLTIGTKAHTAVNVLSLAYLQSALKSTANELFMFELWPLFLLASWSLALKHVYEATTWSIDSTDV